MRRKNKIIEVSWGRSGRMAVDPPTQPQQQMNMNQPGQTPAKPAPSSPPNQPPGGGGNKPAPNSPPPNGTPQNPNQPGNIDIATLKQNIIKQMPKATPDEVEQMLKNQLMQQSGKMEAIFRTLVDLDVLIEKKAIANVKKKFKAKDPCKK
jgi:hypothetical protein